MNLTSFPFETLNWSAVPKEERKGETGVAHWRIKWMNDIRVRLVEYSPGYKADHWCKKGHILHCMEGEMTTELEDGRMLKLTAGTTYFVGDNNEAHRSFTDTGCKLFIVD
jgi:quercetin dioxygenase-like cupin family protein